MKQKKNIGMKVLIGALIFIIPVAVTFFILTQNQYEDLSRGNISSLTLSFEGSEEAEKTTKDRDEIEFFVSVLESGDPIEKTAKPQEEYRLVTLVFHKIKNDVEYRLYLSDSVNDCVYAMPDGALYLIPKAEAAELLAHPLLGNFAYSYASVPALSLKGDGEKQYGPFLTEGSWSYLAADGTKKQSTVEKKEDSIAVLPKGAALSFAYSLEPDYCTVLLTADDGKILYNGTLSHMEPLDLDRDQYLNLSVTCDWYEDAHEDYYGSLHYSFRVFYDVPTDCRLRSASATAGESFVVEVLHSSSETVAVTATFPTGAVKTEKTVDGWLVTVPVSEQAPEGEYTVTLLGSDVEKTFTVTVKAK